MLASRVHRKSDVYALNWFNSVLCQGNCNDTFTIRIYIGILYQLLDKLIGVRSNHGVEYFGGPASPRLFALWAKVFEKRAGVFIRVPYMQGRSTSYVNQGISFVMKLLSIILPHESSEHCKITIFNHHFSQWEQCKQ